jgi:integrase
MRSYPIIKEYQYSGSLSAMCENFVAEKRALGHIYNSEAKMLREFSRFTLDFIMPPDTLSEEVVKAWVEKRPGEAQRNHHSRFLLIRQFSDYMQRMGYSTYCFDNAIIPKCRSIFTPYIFTHEEIRRFFIATDTMKLSAHSIAPRRHLIMPVLFRVLYCCGLRVSEATELRGEDVNLIEGILTVRDSKFGKSRYIPMSEELTTVCAKYAETRLVAKHGDDWFFAAPDGGHYGQKGIYSVFRELLWKAGISHGGRGKGPRVHDFRHTFCVHCLQKWVKQGKDLTNLLPRLTTYVGHSGFESTEQYLRMTAEVYPEISALMQKQYGYIIPKQEDMPL